MNITFPLPLDDLPALCRQLEAEGLQLVRLEPDPSGRGQVAVTREVDSKERTDEDGKVS